MLLAKSGAQRNPPQLARLARHQNKTVPQVAIVTQYRLADYLSLRKLQVMHHIQRATLQFNTHSYPITYWNLT
jgi:hypothetical protein